MGDLEVNKDLYLSLQLAYADILDESIGYLMRAMKRFLHIKTYSRNATNLEFNKRGRCCRFHSRISQYIFVHPRNRIQSVNNDHFHKCSLARNSGDAANPCAVRSTVIRICNVSSYFASMFMTLGVWLVTKCIPFYTRIIRRPMFIEKHVYLDGAFILFTRNAMAPVPHSAER